MRENLLSDMRLLLVAFLLGMLSFPQYARGEEFKPEQSWNNLKLLKAGTRIQVVDMAKKSVKGVLLSVSDDALNFRTSKGEQSMDRASVYCVKNRDKNHHARNGLIGMAAGAGVLSLVGAGCRECDDSAAATGAVFGALIGTVGFAFGNHQTVYKAENVTPKKNPK